MDSAMRNSLLVICPPATADAFDLHPADGVWQLENHVVTRESGAPQPSYDACQDVFAAILGAVIGFAAE